MRKVIVVVLLLSPFLLAGFRRQDSSPVFIVPKGWPKPVYHIAKNPLSDAGFRLGKKLFYDPVLSRDGTISCASCHTQFSGFTHSDHGLSHGIDGRKGTRNSLTLFNLAWNTSFMWDGGVNHLEVQPLAPITNANEMDNTLANVVAHLDTSMGYRGRFYAAFGDSVITGQRVLKALAQFLVMLESYNSKYDKFVRGEPGGEMTPQEFNGLKLFRKNCASCHKEPLFTDFTFKNIGLPIDTGLNDVGRMHITGEKNDYNAFKVPSLRNVAQSYPYMHDGRFKTLRQAIDHYTGGAVPAHNLARELKDGMIFTETEKGELLAFLETLTDKAFLLDERFREER